MPRAGNAGEPPGQAASEIPAPLRCQAAAIGQAQSLSTPPTSAKARQRTSTFTGASDPSNAGKNMSDAEDAWAFEDAQNVACFTVKSIMNGTEPILQVFHDEDDGAWQMLPASGADASEAMIVGLGQLVQLDQTLAQLADLPLGWVAWRGRKNSPWLRRPTSQLPVA